jgi:hypothetical protein
VEQHELDKITQGYQGPEAASRELQRYTLLNAALLMSGAKAGKPAPPALKEAVSKLHEALRFSSLRTKPTALELRNGPFPEARWLEMATADHRSLAQWAAKYYPTAHYFLADRARSNKAAGPQAKADQTALRLLGACLSAGGYTASPASRDRFVNFLADKGVQITATTAQGYLHSALFALEECQPSS